MQNIKAAEDGHIAYVAFEAKYEEFLSAVSNETDFGYGKCYRHLKEIRRHAGKLSDSMKRAGKPSRFLEAALVSYDYADVLAIRAAALVDIDRQARICAAAMEVVREAVQYEFTDGIFGRFARPEQSYALTQSLAL